MRRYLRRRWEESCCEGCDWWGPAVYYFETDADLVATRHIEVYDAGQRLLYGPARMEDEHGPLAIGRVFPESDDEREFEVTLPNSTRSGTGRST